MRRDCCRQVLALARPPDAVHILVLSDRDWTHPQAGGTGTNLFGQVSRWIAWGHRVTVIACSYPGAEPHGAPRRLTIHRMGGRSTVFPRVIWKQWRGRVPDADVVLEVINGITFLTPLWLRKPRARRCPPRPPRPLRGRRWAGRGRVAACLLETAAAAAALPRHALPHDLRRHRRATSPRTASRASRSTSATSGWSSRRFEPDPPSSARAEPTLLYLGRLKRYKRIELVLDALERRSRGHAGHRRRRRPPARSWRPRSQRAGWPTACGCTAT